MEAIGKDVLAAWRFGAALDDLFADCSDVVVPPFPEELPFFHGFDKSEPSSSSSSSATTVTTTTTTIPIYLEPRPPGCLRSAESCCCGMGKEEEGEDEQLQEAAGTAAADKGACCSACAHPDNTHGEQDETLWIATTWATDEDEDDDAEISIIKGSLPSIPERLSSCCSCVSGAGSIIKKEEEEEEEEKEEEEEEEEEGGAAPPSAAPPKGMVGRVRQWAQALVQRRRPPKEKGNAEPRLRNKHRRSTFQLLVPVNH
jgi:hypothetical protein